MSTKLTEMLNSTETATASVDKNTVVEPTIHTINIFHFYYNKEGQLIVQYREGNKERSAIAHPALQVKPLMGKELIAKIEECKPKWKLRSPIPTEEQRAEYRARQQVVTPQVVELTEEEKSASQEF